MPDYRMFQIIVTGLALLYLYFKSRQVAREGQSTMPEIIQIVMWGVALLLALNMPERIGPLPFFVLELVIIVVVSTRLNLWRVRKQREEILERRRQAEAKEASPDKSDTDKID